MKLIRLLLLFVLALPAFADPSGDWKTSFEGPDGTLEFIFRLKTEGAKLTGAVIGPFGEFPISNGKADGDNLTFTVSTEQFTFNYQAAVSGDEMKLQVDGGQGTIDLVAKRVAP